VQKAIAVDAFDIRIPDENVCHLGAVNRWTLRDHRWLSSDGNGMTQFDEPVMFLATADSDRSRAFYERVLGLTFVADEPYALVFRVGHSRLRIQKVDRVPKVSHTVLGWAVQDIRSTVTQLTAAGVTFQRYDGMDQDDQGVWRSPNGALVAWFRDPDGNTLSFTQYK